MIDARKQAVSDPQPDPQLTRLLDAWRSDGDIAARNEVMSLVYDQVRRLAARELGRQSGPRALTLRPTDLAHELFLRLLGSDSGWENRRHFYNAAIQAMRQILIDTARQRHSEKRGGGGVHLTLSAAEDVATAEHPGEAVVEALDALNALDPRKAEVAQMRYLLGLEHTEIAALVNVSVSTVERDLRLARAWLQNYLTDDS